MTFSIFFSNVALDSLDFACSHIPPPRAHLLDVGLSALQGLLRTTQAAAGHRPWICVGGYNSTPADIAPLLQLFGGELVSSPNKPVGRATASLITCGREANSSLSLQQGDVDALWTCFIDTLRLLFQTAATALSTPSSRRLLNHGGHLPPCFCESRATGSIKPSLKPSTHTLDTALAKRSTPLHSVYPPIPVSKTALQSLNLPVPGLNCGGRPDLMA